MVVRASLGLLFDLKPEQGSTRSAVRTHFKRFCQYLDRSILGRRYMSNPARRTLIIVFVEHADTTNPHLHGLVLFQDGKSWGPIERERKVLLAWERAVKSGTIDMQEVYEPAGRCALHHQRMLVREELRQHDDLVGVLR